MSVEIQASGEKLELYRDGLHIGSVIVGHNRFHSRYPHLEFRLKTYNNAWASELFTALRVYFRSPLQIGLASEELELINFLTVGGFQLMRRCTEVDAAICDLLPGEFDNVSLRSTFKGDPDYLALSKRFYEYYRRSHEKVSPLTATFSDFFNILPSQITASADGLHFAYVEENEIAYVCSDAPDSFAPFGHTLAGEMFKRHKQIHFECDDCDNAAMALLRLFKPTEYSCWDTYIYE